MKIITVTMNPCVDVNYKLDKPFTAGELNRVPMPTTSVNGKGINVSRVLKTLGEESTVMTISSTDGSLEKVLEKEGLNVTSVQVRGTIRRNTAILDSDGVQTQINEPGMDVPDTKLAEFISFYKSELGVNTDKIVVLSGSLPHGMDSSVYRKLAIIAKNSGAYVVVDTSGENLKSALEAMPDLIKPNLEEFEALIGKKFTETGEALRRKVYEEAVKFYRTRYTAVLCTLGEYGSVIACGEGSFLCDAKKTDIKTFKGAGDAFLAAFIYYNRVKEKDAETSLVLASTTASKYLSS